MEIGAMGMLRAIRKRMTYLNAAITLAIVFAMTGGAFAASKYVITSVKQIKPNVLKQLQGKAGPVGPEGKPGPQGEKGAGGVNGTNGTSGENGKNGENGKSVAVGLEPKGTNCKEGGTNFEVEGSGTKHYACNGVTGYSEALPSGKSERGVWSLGETDQTQPNKEEIEVARSNKIISVSFVIPLKEPLAEKHAIFVSHQEEVENKVPTECGGTSAEPQAKKGYLCVYGFTSNSKAEEFVPLIVNPEGYPFGTPMETAGVGGALLYFSNITPQAFGWGDWVVTAP